MESDPAAASAVSRSTSAATAAASTPSESRVKAHKSWAQLVPSKAAGRARACALTAPISGACSTSRLAKAHASVASDWGSYWAARGFARRYQCRFTTRRRVREAAAAVAPVEEAAEGEEGDGGAKRRRKETSRQRKKRRARERAEEEV